MNIHIDEFRQIVNEYARIAAETDDLLKLIEELEIRKITLANDLEENKKLEEMLIDKIIKETGEKPDYYKIMVELNEPKVTT